MSYLSCVLLHPWKCIRYAFLLFPLSSFEISISMILASYKTLVFLGSGSKHNTFSPFSNLPLLLKGLSVEDIFFSEINSAWIIT